MMVLPLAENGSLEDYLRHGQRLNGLGFAKVVSASIQSERTGLVKTFQQSVGIARALSYLHSRIVPVIHGDLHWVHLWAIHPHPTSVSCNPLTRVMSYLPVLAKHYCATLDSVVFATRSRGHCR